MCVGGEQRYMEAMIVPYSEVPEKWGRGVCSNFRKV